MPILISPALVITPVDTYPATYPVVGWDNQVAFSNITSDSADTSYPVTNLANPNTSQKWLSAGTAEQLVTVSSLEGLSDYVGIARHNFGTAGIEVSVEGITAEPGAVWEEVFPGVLPADDTPLLLRFASDYYIGLRLRLIPDATAPSAAVLYAGLALVLMRGLQPGFTPITAGQTVEMLNGRSERGEHLGAIITGQARDSTATIKTLDPDWYTENMKPFVDAANLGQPFFFAWNPSEHPDEIGFCWFESTVRPVYAQLTQEIDISLPMGGLAL